MLYGLILGILAGLFGSFYLIWAVTILLPAHLVFLYFYNPHDGLIFQPRRGLIFPNFLITLYAIVLTIMWLAAAMEQYYGLMGILKFIIRW